MHIYFSAIGGVGIGPLAMLALDAGFTISGSDLHESAMTETLKSRGVKVAIGQDGTHIAATHTELNPIDWFVYSSALPEDHPELSFARQNGIRTSKRDEFLNFFMKEKDLKLLAVAGTHGKTTTTAMITWLLRELNQQLSYSIGTSISFGPSAQYQPGAKYFIYECDEFDRNFLNFQPELSVIASVDYDHPDTYPTVTSYKQAFVDFINQSKHTLLWNQSAKYLQISSGESVTIFNESETTTNEIKLPGEHMRKNAWLAAQAVFTIMPEQDIAVLRGMMRDFPGTARRFEKLAENLYTDYAHHPVEIMATLSMARELNQSVVVVYQPHQNVRQHEIVREDAYRHCFNGAKLVYWLPTYLSREDPNLPILSPTELLGATSSETNAQYIDMNDVLWQKIQSHAKNGDLVLALSAGDLDLWLREKLHV